MLLVYVCACMCASKRLLLSACLAVLFASVGSQRRCSMHSFSDCVAASTPAALTCLYFGLSTL